MVVAMVTLVTVSGSEVPEQDGGPVGMEEEEDDDEKEEEEAEEEEEEYGEGMEDGADEEDE